MEHVTGLGDGHCHVAGVYEGLGDALAAAIKGRFAPGFFCLMCTHAGDLGVVEDLLGALGDSRAVVPYFGVHPWYSHLFCIGEVSKRAHYEAVLEPAPSDALMEELPDPVPLEAHLERIQRVILQHAESDHFVYGIGEIGLDKLFRVPTSGWYARPGFGHARLSECRVSLKHQEAVFLRQLRFAGDLGVPVSVHCVKAHGPLFELMTGPAGSDIPTAILHSYTGLVDQAQRWVKAYQKRSERLCFSFSNWINGTEAKHQLLSALLAILDDDQVLLETDLSIDRFLLGPAGKSLFADERSPSANDHRETPPKNELKDYCPLNDLEITPGLQNSNTSVSDLKLSQSNVSVPELDYLGHLRGIFEKVCAIRGWDLDHGRKVLGQSHQSAVGVESASRSCMVRRLDQNKQGDNIVLKLS